MSPPSLSAAQIDELQRSLRQHREQLEAQLRDGDAATQPVTLDQQSVGRISRVDAIQQQQMAIANQQQAMQLMQRVELALRRIDENLYGYCLRCEEPIALARLQAQPFASLCIDCQAASEET